MSTAITHTLRIVADLLDAHPDLPTPYVTIYDHKPGVAELKWYLHINDKGDETEQRAAAQTILRSIGGRWDKSFGDTDARFRQERDGIDFSVVVVREAVCTRRVVGSETVTLPAVKAQPKRTVEREVVEWDCAPVLTEQVSA